MALQTTQLITRDNTGGGLAPTYNAVAATDTFVPDGLTFLHVKNGSGASINVNVTVPAGREAIPNLTIKTPLGAFAVPAGGDRMIGPFPASYFADPTTGLATVTYSAQTTVTAAVLKVTQP